MADGRSILLRTFLHASTKLLDKIDNESYVTILSYIQESTDDLEGSYLLYNNRHYRNSIILLAQSVEKISKGLFLHLKIIDKKRAKAVSHLTPTLWLDLIDSNVGQLGLMVSGQDFEKLNQDMERLSEIVRKTEKIADMSLDDIKSLLKFSDDTEKHIFGFIESFFPSKKRREFILNWAKSITRLYYLSFVVFSHYQYARYQADHSKEMIYDENHPMVIVYPELKSRLEECITSIAIFAEEAYKRNE